MVRLRGVNHKRNVNLPANTGIWVDCPAEMTGAQRVVKNDENELPEYAETLG